MVCSIKGLVCDRLSLNPYTLSRTTINFNDVKIVFNKIIKFLAIWVDSSLQS